MNFYSPPLHMTQLTAASLNQALPTYNDDSVLDQQQRALQAAINAIDQAPGPSLREVLGAYRLKGDGDREMLLAILNAKAAEDQRVASMASLHQTILQAVHSSAVSLALPPLATAGVPDAAASRLERDSPTSWRQPSEVSTAGSNSSGGTSRAPVMSISSITSPSLHTYPSPPMPRNHMDVGCDQGELSHSAGTNSRRHASSSRSASTSASGSRAASRSSSQRPRQMHRHSPISRSGSEGRRSFERVSSERSTS